MRKVGIMEDEKAGGIARGRELSEGADSLALCGEP